MSSNTYFVSIIILFFAFRYVFSLGFQNREQKKAIHIDRYHIKCPGVRNTKHLPIFIDKVNIKHVANGFLANITVIVKKELKGTDSSVTFFMERCQSKEALDTCEPLVPFKINNACGFIRPDRQTIISHALKKFKPSIVCPLKPGTYVMTDGTLDVNFILNAIPFKLEGLYWKIMGKLHNETTKKLTFCAGGEGRVITVK